MQTGPEDNEGNAPHCSHAAQPRARATAAPGVRGRALGLDWLHGFHLVGLARAKGGTSLRFPGRCQAGIYLMP